MLDMTGDTAGYLLYAHARLFSVLQRVSEGDGNRYQAGVEMLLNSADPFGKLNKLVDYDFQHLPQNQLKNGAYESLLDLVVHNPNLAQKFLPNNDLSNTDSYNALLVSSVLAQYQSGYATDMTSLVYPRKKHHHDDLWLTTSSSLETSNKQVVNQSYLKSVTNNVNSIDHNYGVSMSSNINGDQHDQIYNTIPTISLHHESERALGLHIAQFHDALGQTVASLSPNVLAGYTHGLSTAFTSFYRDCTVNIKDEKVLQSLPMPVGTKDQFSTQDSRVLLTHATTVTLQRCLDLIGIQPTKFM
jgi:hypothetical protein